MQRRGLFLNVFLACFALSLPLIGAPITVVIAQENADLPASVPFDVPGEIAPLWAQVAAQPQDFGVACMPLYDSRQTVLYNGDAFPLASVTKLLIFIEYAQRVDEGRIGLDATVPVATLERYNLPRTDRGAHDRFMERYAAGTTELPIWEVAAEGMIQYSSNAASDFMLDYLAPVDWQALYNRLFLYETDYPTSLTMIPLLMNNHDTGVASMDDLAALSTEQGEGYLDQYVDDATWRNEEIVYRTQRGRSFSSRSSWPDWDVQAAILQDYTATGNVNDFLNVLTAIYSENSPLSINVKYMVRTAMRWEDNEYINENYVEFGSKLGFYSGGVLALVAYGEPYNGTPVISVTFMRNIPRRTYYNLLREDEIGNFTHWMNFNACAGLRELLDATSR